MDDSEDVCYVLLPRTPTLRPGATPAQRLEYLKRLNDVREEREKKWMTAKKKFAREGNQEAQLYLDTVLPLPPLPEELGVREWWWPTVVAGGARAESATSPKRRSPATGGLAVPAKKKAVAAAATAPAVAAEAAEAAAAAAADAAEAAEAAAADAAEAAAAAAAAPAAAPTKARVSSQAFRPASTLAPLRTLDRYFHTQENAEAEMRAARDAKEAAARAAAQRVVVARAGAEARAAEAARAVAPPLSTADRLALAAAHAWAPDPRLAAWLKPLDLITRGAGMRKPLLLLAMADNLRDATVLTWVRKAAGGRALPHLVDAPNVNGPLPHHLRALWSERDVMRGDRPYVPVVINLTEPKRLENLLDMLNKRTADAEFYPTVLVVDALYGDGVPRELGLLRRHPGVMVLHVKTQLPDMVESEVKRVLGARFGYLAAHGALARAHWNVSAALRALEFEAVGSGAAAAGGAAAVMDADPLRDETMTVARLLLCGVEAPATVSLALISKPLAPPPNNRQVERKAVESATKDIKAALWGPAATVAVCVHRRPPAFRLHVPPALVCSEAARMRLSATVARFGLIARPGEGDAEAGDAFDLPPAADETCACNAWRALLAALELPSGDNKGDIFVGAALPPPHRIPDVPLLLVDVPNFTSSLDCVLTKVEARAGLVRQGPPVYQPYNATRLASGNARGATMLWLGTPPLISFTRKLRGARAAGSEQADLPDDHPDVIRRLDLTELDALADAADAICLADTLDNARYTLNTEALDRYAAEIRARAPHAVCARHFNVSMEYSASCDDSERPAHFNGRQYAAKAAPGGLPRDCQKLFIDHIQAEQARRHRHCAMLDAIPLVRAEAGAAAAGGNFGSTGLGLLDACGLGAYGLVPQARAEGEKGLRAWTALRVDSKADVAAWFAVAPCARPLPQALLGPAARSVRRPEQEHVARLPAEPTGPTLVAWLLGELNVAEDARDAASKETVGQVLSAPCWRAAFTAFALFVRQEQLKPVGQCIKLGRPGTVRVRLCRMLTRPDKLPDSVLHAPGRPLLSDLPFADLADAVDQACVVSRRKSRGSLNGAEGSAKGEDADDGRHVFIASPPPVTPRPWSPPAGRTAHDFATLDVPGAVVF